MERKKFTPAEDQAILDFARRKSGSFKLTGNALWQLAESINLTCHPWQSMRSRYMLLSSPPAAKRPRTGQPSRTRHPPTTGKLPTMPPLQRRLSFTTTSTATRTSASPSYAATNWTSTSTSTSTYASTYTSSFTSTTTSASTSDMSSTSTSSRTFTFYSR